MKSEQWAEFELSKNHLREKFSELARAEPHLGLDPGAPSLEDPASTLELERFNLGRKVLAANHAPLSQEFLKKGAPHSLRGKLWSQVLGCGSGGEEGMVGSGGGAGPSGITAKESEYYQSLQVILIWIFFPPNLHDIQSRFFPMTYRKLWSLMI